MTTVYLALGSNIGNSLEHIRRAITLLGKDLDDIKQAPLYASKAVGYTDQPDFLNTAVSGQTDLTPQELLVRAKSIESQVGRTASFHWGPREIDIDIIFYGNSVIKTAELIVPHPRLRERDFVLQPLCDLNPGLIDPLSQQTVQNLLAQINPGQKSLIKKVD